MVFTRKSLAHDLKLSVSTIDRNRKTGKLPCHNAGDRIFFTEDDRDTFINACISTISTTSPSNTSEQETETTTGGEK